LLSSDYFVWGNSLWFNYSFQHGILEGPSSILVTIQMAQPVAFYAGTAGFKSF